MTKAIKKLKENAKEMQSCPICMVRAVNVVLNLFSAKLYSALTNFAIAACLNGAGYFFTYLEKRQLSPLSKQYQKNPLQKEDHWAWVLAMFWRVKFHTFQLRSTGVLTCSSDSYSRTHAILLRIFPASDHKLPSDELLLASATQLLP